MTKFAFEVPHAHLDDFKDLQDFHFALSLHCYKSFYKNFFLHHSVTGVKQVWLDNSFNETGKADKITNLTQLADEIGAHKLIVPDNPTWSIEKVIKEFEASCKYIPASRAVVVINSERMYDGLIKQGALCFALSYHIRLPHYNKGGQPEDFLWAKECHFLGLCSIQELARLRPPSCDTSIPIKLAINGIRLLQWYEEGCPRIHHPPGVGKLPYYDLVLTEEQLKLAKENITMLKIAVNGGIK